MNSILFFDWGYETIKNYRFKIRIIFKDIVFTSKLFPTKEDFLNNIQYIKNNLRDFYVTNTNHKKVGKILDVFVKDNKLIFDLQLDIKNENKMLNLDAGSGKKYLGEFHINSFDIIDEYGNINVEKVNNSVSFSKNDSYYGIVEGTLKDSNTKYKEVLGFTNYEKATRIGKKYLFISIYNLRIKDSYNGLSSFYPIYEEKIKLLFYNNDATIIF